MSKNPSKKALRSLGKKYLNRDGKKDLEEFIRDNEIFLAQVKLQGAIDRALNKNKISMEEAYEDYERLGLTPEECVAIMDAVEEHLASRRTKH